MSTPTDTPIEPTDSLEFVDETADQEEVVRDATAARPELKAVAWNEKIYDEAIGIYKADMQPRLDFDGAYGWSVLHTSNFFEGTYKKWSLAVTLKVPAGTRTGRTFRVRKRGIPHGKGAGDLLVTVEVAIPQKLSAAERKAVEALAAAATGEGPRAHLGVDGG